MIRNGFAMFDRSLFLEKYGSRFSGYSSDNLSLSLLPPLFVFHVESLNLHLMQFERDVL